MREALEHLLLCQECVDRMEAVEHFVTLIWAGSIRVAFEVELPAEEHKPD